MPREYLDKPGVFEARALSGTKRTLSRDGLLVASQGAWQRPYAASRMSELALHWSVGPHAA